MSKEKASIIASEILKLRSDGDLKLTVFGAITLSPFPAKIILKARDKFRQTCEKDINIAKPFNYFLALCLDSARALSIMPDWAKSNELCEHYNLTEAVRVTEDDEFLTNSPLLAKKIVDAQLKRASTPKKRYNNREKQCINSPEFDGTTYTYGGRTYLRPKENREWINPEIEERLNKPTEYWEQEKLKFVYMIRDKKVDIKGMKFLIVAGFINKKEMEIIAAGDSWTQCELDSMIRLLH